MAPLGIVIEDVPSVRKGLVRMLESAGCNQVVPLPDSHKLMSYLKQEPKSRLVILVSDLMDSKKAGKHRGLASVFGVAEHRVKQLVDAQKESPQVKVIVYSLAPTLAAGATADRKQSGHYEKLLTNLHRVLAVDDDDIVGKLGPGAETFPESLERVAHRAKALIRADGGDESDE